MFQQRSMKHRIQLTRFNKKERKILHSKIKSLGGVYVESTIFDPNCAYIICKIVCRTEKFLGACAMGKWILNENYIHDSYAKKQWLDPEAYEWSTDTDEKIAAMVGDRNLLCAPKQCRLMYGQQGHGPFVNWKVALLCEKTVQAAYKRLLQHGGAKVCHVKLISSCTKSLKESLTHVIVSEEMMNSNENVLRQVKQLRDLGVACVKDIYIGNYLINFPKPDLDQYLLPRDYVPSTCAVKGQRAANIGDDINYGITDELITPLREKAVVTAQSPVINLNVWPSPVKTSPVMSVKPKSRCRKRKQSQEDGRSQQKLYKWLSPVKKDSSCDRLASFKSHKSVNSKPEQEDVKIIEPRYVQTVLSPVKSISDEKHGRRCYARCTKSERVTLETSGETNQGKSKRSSRVQQRKKSNIPAYSTREAGNCGRSCINEDYYNQHNSDVICPDHLSSPETAKEMPVYFMRDVFSYGNKSMMLKINAGYHKTPSVIKIHDVLNESGNSYKVLSIVSKSGKSMSMVHLPGIKEAAEVKRLLDCTVILHSCEAQSQSTNTIQEHHVKSSLKSSKMPVLSSKNCQINDGKVANDEFVEKQGNPILYKKGHRNMRHLPPANHEEESAEDCLASKEKAISEKIKFSDGLSWLPAYSVIQCWDVKKGSIGQMNIYTPGSVLEPVLVALMDKEEGWFPLRVLAAVQLLAASCYCLPSHIIGRIMTDILWDSEDRRQANLAYMILSNVLESYPPVTEMFHKLHLQSLCCYQLSGNEKKAGWMFVKDVIYHSLSCTPEQRQHQYNSCLLLRYIVIMLERNFSHHYSSCAEVNSRNHRTPMIAEIMWPQAYRVMDSSCLDLIALLMEAIQTEGLPNKMAIVELLQSLVTMVAHCLVFADRNTFHPKLANIPLPACLFAKQLANSIDDLNNINHLKLALKIIRSPWLVFKVTHNLLDMYDSSLSSRVIINPQDRLVSLQNVLNWYTHLIPKKAENVEQAVTSKKYVSTNDEMNASRNRFEMKAQFNTLKILSNVNQRNCKGETALHRACINNNIIRVRQLLQVPGIDVNAADYAGWTPLHEASNRGHLDCVIELLNYRPPHNKEENHRTVDVFMTNVEGISVLHDAVMNDQIDVARVLIQRGGGKLLQMKTNDGKKASDLVVSDEMRQLLRQHESLSSLSSENQVAGASSDVSTSRKPLLTYDQLLSKGSCEDINKTLETEKANITPMQYTKYTILVYHMVVSYIEHYRLIDLLKEQNSGAFKLPASVSHDVDTARQLKTFVHSFKKHLDRLSPDASQSQTSWLTLLNLMADCMATE